MRKLFIVDHDFPPTPEDMQSASEAGATEVLCGIPEALAGQVSGFGYHEVGSPEPTSPPVPEAVDMRQARLKLLSEPHGEGTRLDAVNAYVATQDANVEIEWSFARELRRDHPMVGIMGFFFGMDSDDLDQWFREAAAIGPTLAL